MLPSCKKAIRLQELTQLPVKDGLGDVVRHGVGPGPELEGCIKSAHRMAVKLGVLQKAFCTGSGRSKPEARSHREQWRARQLRHGEARRYHPDSIGLKHE